MIIRQQARRQLRRGFARPWSRQYATEIDGIEQSAADEFQHAGGAASTAPGDTTTLEKPSRRMLRPLDPLLRTWRAHQHMQETTANYGANVAPHYEPHKLLSNPPRPSQVTLELLLASQAHLGHSTSLWNPLNSRYIFGVRDDIHIISLDVTSAHLRRAAKIVQGAAERAGIILFVGTRPGFDRAVVRAAQLAKGYHLFDRWTPGTITNSEAILDRCKMKVVDEFDRQVKALDDQLVDRRAVKPDLVVVLNTIENRALLHECALASIPTIGIIDTDCDPTKVTYPIPANDDSVRCIQVIAGVLGRAGEEGQRVRREYAKNGKVHYKGSDSLFLPSGFDMKSITNSSVDANAVGEEYDSINMLDEIQEKLDNRHIQLIEGNWNPKRIPGLQDRLEPNEFKFLQNNYDALKRQAEEEGKTLDLNPHSHGSWPTGEPEDMIYPPETPTRKTEGAYLPSYFEPPEGEILGLGEDLVLGTESAVSSGESAPSRANGTSSSSDAPTVSLGSDTHPLRSS